MIGVDTNVLLRVLVVDDEQQTAIARRLLARAEDEGATVFVPVVVLAETAWVLRSVYRFGRPQIAAALAAVLSSDQTEFENAAVVERALRAFESGTADLADYIAREAAIAAGAQALVTFDRAAHREPGFLHPDPTTWPDDLSLHEASPRYARRRRRTVPAGR